MESIHDDHRTERSKIMALALEAVAEGMATFPLRGKIPAIKKCPEADAKGLTGAALAEHARHCRGFGHGLYDASTQPQRVMALFNAAKGATGYGIAMGEASGGNVAVDVDGPAARREGERHELTSGRVVKSGRPEGDGWHIYLKAEAKLKSCDLAPGLELKAEGTYVVGPGSAYPAGGTYRLAKGGDPAPVPAWIVSAATAAAKAQGGAHRAGEGNVAPVAVDLAGPPIPDGGRNHEVTRIAGRLHDGTRDLPQLTADLQAVNDARCTPPLDEGEVAKIAASIYGRPPCNPAPEPTPWVKAAVDYLRSVERPIKGMAGSTGWAIYSGLLDHAGRYGREHDGGVAVSVDRRTLAQLAGVTDGTVTRWIHRTNLVSVARPGSGRRASILLLHVPKAFKGAADEGHQLHHSPTKEVSKNNQPSRSDATRALHRTIYRLRWSGGGTKARPGVVKGAAKVRQGRPAPSDGIKRIGKAKAAILAAVADCGGEVSRADLAARLGRNPDSMRRPLRELVEAGLLVRPRRGYYDVPEDVTERLDDARELGREPEADRLQIADHNRQRAAYRNPVKAEPVPTEQQMRERRENAPANRRAAIERAIAALFADHPEYRSRRVGQITCGLMRYIGPDFPRGQLGAPKDHEVELILDGEAA